MAIAKFIIEADCSVRLAPCGQADRQSQMRSALGRCPVAYLSCCNNSWLG